MQLIIYFFANSLIFLSTIKESILFYISTINIIKVQKNKQEVIFRNNKNTELIKKYEKEGLSNPNDFPLTKWENYETYIQKVLENEQNILTREKVILLEPTSGTTSPTKFIPYTTGLQKEFNNAIYPWLCGIYLFWPKLFFCSQYWSLSPEIQHGNENSNINIPIGFQQDSQYLGKKSSNLLNKIMAVPYEIKNCTNKESWAYITAYYLLYDKNLGLISIWHPSFLIIILDIIKQNFSTLISDIKNGKITGQVLAANPNFFIAAKPNRKRAEYLGSLNINADGVFNLIWPKLKVISCWADNQEDPSLIIIKSLFPKTFIQAKGIIATEGIVSFPFGKISGIPALRSHYLEFIDIENESIKKIHQLEKDKKYEVVITTSGGLYRYRMNDVVLVKAILKNKLPLLHFLYKRDYVSDIRGEKLSLQHVESIYASLKMKFTGILYFMLSPVIDGSKAYYTCFIQLHNTVGFPYLKLKADIDEELKKNFHYQYAREIKQLNDLRIFVLDKNPVNDIINYIESTGIKRGDIKLYSLSKITVWPKYLDGRFVEI